ncbi:MAG: DUF2220 family protein [Desulfosporosinus sp.]|nr:DUF2220 family protein [Desulfosporosinus sp.]
MEKLFLIENLAPFLEIYKGHYIDRPDVAIIWMAGYLSSAKRLIIKKLLQNKKVPVFIWSDIDADGILLANDAIRYVNSLGCLCSPVLMTENEVRLTQGKYKGSRMISPHNDIEPVFSGIISEIEKGLAMEQEELFLHYKYVEAFLP